MNKIQIETAQNVQIYQIPAGLGVRILAFVLDMLIISCYEILMVIFINSINTGIYSDTVEIYLLSFLFGAPVLLYHLMMEIFNNGQSLGKAVFKLRVVCLDGTAPKFSNYLIRWMMRLIDIALTTGAMASILILLNGKGQRLGDIAAKTTVISEKQKFQLEDEVYMEEKAEYIPVYPQVTLLSDAEIQKIRRLYKNANTDKNQKVIENLSKKIAEILDITPAEDPNDFVERVIMDYTFYTQKL